MTLLFDTACCGARNTIELSGADLWIAQALTSGPVAMGFPGDVLAVVYSSRVFLGFSTSLGSLPNPRE